MKDTMLRLEQIIPEGMQDFKIRYAVLQTILENEPIGRRLLANLTTYSERTIRTATDLLNKQGLIEVAHSGMIVTTSGKVLLDELYEPLQTLHALSALESEIEILIGARKVTIVPGNVDQDESAKWQIGKAGSNLVLSLLGEDDVVAITGGSTIAKMVELMPAKQKEPTRTTIIPARGSIGKRMEYQANILAGEFAKKINGKHEVLNIPDNLSANSIETIKQEPHIQKTLQKMAKSDMIILGLGDAMKMAKRRNESQEVIALLQHKGAVAEAFRYYFDEKGEVIYSATNIGLDLEMVKRISTRVVLAGGSSKAVALLATKELLKDSYLILDEGAAKKMIEVSIR
ncbi:MAG: sugar-binding domain-containing protein [Niameybacter sp.]|uniref:sugar-binding transcriptional regulator n=1 Tax=Niameybacter sp. TaxID=2033640 RepID=UPI002FC9F581